MGEEVRRRKHRKNFKKFARKTKAFVKGLQPAESLPSQDKAANPEGGRMQLTMKRTFQKGLYALAAHGLLQSLLAAQPGPQMQAVERFFAGHKVLISYREGSPLRATYLFIQAHFCPRRRTHGLARAENERPALVKRLLVGRIAASGQWLSKRGRLVFAVFLRRAE